MKKPVFQLQFLIVVSVFLLLLNLSVGWIIFSHMSAVLKTQIQDRMLGVANTAASMIDGDKYEKITATGGDSPEYRHVFGVLRSFASFSNSKYVYGIRQEKNGKFIFTIDPALTNAAVFGEEVVVTDALRKAASGVPSVCDESYQDIYGSFYSAYSPIRNSFGTVVGIVAVDCDAEWYAVQMKQVGLLVAGCCVVSLFIGACIVMLFARQLQKRFRELNEDMRVLAGEVDSFTRKMVGSESNTPSVYGQDPQDSSSGVLGCSGDEIRELSRQIQHMRHDLQEHIDKVYVLAFRDPLTGVKSKQAYVEYEKMTDRMIQENSIQEFAVVLLDVNGLKYVNDKFGHNAGDRLLKSASAVICESFPFSPVFRIGGDEFVVVLRGVDYLVRTDILEKFNKKMAGNVESGDVVIAAGISDYKMSSDHCFHDVFVRADSKMYEQKKQLKLLGSP